MPITATFVAGPLSGFRGDARLYRLSEPVEGEECTFDHVVVSAVVVEFSGPETYIFPADAEGKVRGWLDLPGSFQGALDHAHAIHEAGWVLAEPAAP